MHMNVFQQNAAGAFSLVSMTAALLDQPHIPMRLGQLGIFDASGMRTLKASIERQGNTLQLVQTTPRNTPGIQNVRDGRTLIDIPTSRIQLEDTITADEVQGIRAFGSESDLMTLQQEVNARNARMSNSIEATIEFQRIGAIKGLVLDADGSTLINLFTTFGVSQQSEVAFDLSNVANGQLRVKCSSVIRMIEDELGGLPYSSIHAMCSSQFFDDLTANSEFRAFHLQTVNAEKLAERIARRQVDFGGITFEEYRGAVGGTKYVADDKAHIMPLGVPDLFLTRYAPAEYFDTVNTVGLPRYARMFFDPRDPLSKVLSVVQTNIFNICTRPRVLIPAKRGA